jgi:Rnl2 family RNA ligase
VRLDVPSEAFCGKNDITVQVIGEIYGGKYDGHTGKTKTKPVQKEIKYCPDVDVRAFDVMIDGKYQNYLEMIKLFDQCSKLPYVPILHMGTLEEMLKLNPVFPTTLPALYGFESIPLNDAEGYVLKPAMPRFITFSEDSIERVIFKLKNPKFSEKNEMNTPDKPVIIVEGIPDNIDERIASYINQNRMDNVQSKLSEAERKNKGKVIQGLIRDVMDELIRDLTDQNQYNDAIKATLKNLVSKEVAKFVMTKI